MSTTLIINGAQPGPISAGQLNARFAAEAAGRLAGRGHRILETAAAGAWDIEEEIAKHVAADTIILQFPVHWMGAPWGLKRYMDEVHTLAMDGRLANGDGRSRHDPSAQYGSGGTATDTRYMFSVTFNAPAAAFDDPDQYLFGGRSLEDLLFPVHMGMRFMGMTALPSFAAYDVVKNPTIEDDLARFRAHLDAAVDRRAAA
ncbi:MAG: NAD(P)H-dependent oxidoreductase [Pseudomonadota bacterium]